MANNIKPILIRKPRHIDHAADPELARKIDKTYREAFDNIYLDLSKQPGKCRVAEGGLGWKPIGGGDTFTLDKVEVVAAQWSRAARGHELKVHTRSLGVIQLDGFQPDVRPLKGWRCSSAGLTVLGPRAPCKVFQNLVQRQLGAERARTSWLELG